MWGLVASCARPSRGGLRAQCPGHVRVICVAEAEPRGAGAFPPRWALTFRTSACLWAGVGREDAEPVACKAGGQAGSADGLGHGSP